jgi:dodecin
MSVAKNIEITSTSAIGFEDAIRSGIQRASRTINNIRGAWIKEQKVQVAGENVTEFCVTMIITFVLTDES